MSSIIYKQLDRQQQEIMLDAVKKIIDRACTRKKQVKLFFRADDIAVPSKNFDRMTALFLKYQMPLCLAVVPAWMTKTRWEAIKPFRDKGGHLLCWHMHGYRHHNHEATGRKQEFGPQRTRADIFQDLANGRERLVSILGKALTPVFTPPWNRCSQQTLFILKDLGFKGVSRNHGASPSPPHGLKDIAVHVDLHTRKDKTPQTGRQNLLKEFETGFFAGVCGIMIHHMCMDKTAFDFLDALLALMSADSRIERVTYADLI